MDSHSILMLILAAFLVALNGFFVAAEFGLVKLRQTRVKALAKTKGFKGKILLKVHKELDAYLSACQLGITLASLGLGWIGEPAFAKLLTPLFENFGIDNPQLIHTISFAVAFSIISYLHIVVGELAPKSFALRKAEITGLWLSFPLYCFYWLMYPFIKILNKSSDFILKSFGLPNSKESAHDGHYSAEELKLILKRPSSETGKFKKDEWNILAHALDFSELEVSDLMRPFNEAITMHCDENKDNLIKTISTNKFSRYPIIENDESVERVIHVKKLFAQLNNDINNINLEELSSPALIVPPDMPALELFRRFKNGAAHFAIIGYKKQKPLGFITLDNLLGALVGEIRDEFKCSTNDWSKLEDGSLIGKGSLSIFTLERALDIDIEENEVDSISGLILKKLDRLPVEGDLIEFNQFDISIKKMSGPRIVLLRVHPKEPKQDDFIEEPSTIETIGIDNP